MATFQSDGIEIFFTDQGSGLPVLLIHGFASNQGINWRDTGWIDQLVRDGFRVIALDNRGHGQSQKLYEKSLYGAPLMAEDARRLLDHLGIERAFVLGYSMGARIAAFLTINHPKRIIGSVFSGLGINMVHGIGGGERIASALLAPRAEAITDPVGRSFRYFADQTNSDLRALAACILSSRRKITEAEIGSIATPVLVAVGGDDEIAGSAQALADLLPNGEALCVPGRDHMKMVGDRRHKEAAIDFFNRHAPIA